MKLTLPFLLALLWLTPAQAATESQLSAIAGMGKLNGVALQCSYVEQMQRIKMTLVLHLPKQRALGDWFEHSTSESFMEFMSKGLPCPGPQLFIEQVDTAVKTIETVFKQ